MTRSLVSFDIRYSISVSVFFNWHPDLKNSIKVLFRVLIVGYFFFFFLIVIIIKRRREEEEIHLFVSLRLLSKVEMKKIVALNQELWFIVTIKIINGK